MASVAALFFFLTALIDDVNQSPQLHVSKGTGDFEGSVNKDHESSKTFNAQQVSEERSQTKISSAWRWWEEKKVRTLRVSTVLQNTWLPPNTLLPLEIIHILFIFN